MTGIETKEVHYRTYSSSLIMNIGELRTFLADIVDCDDLAEFWVQGKMEDGGLVFHVNENLS